MSKLCIYPQDETTAFLKPIADVLQGDGFEVLDDDTRTEGYVEKVLKDITRHDYVVFLGHGSSAALSGTNQVPLIDSENVDVMRGKRLFLLACNSKDFILSFDLKDAIGFGIIPTSNMDVNAIVDQDFCYFETIPEEEDLEWFRLAVVRIVVNAFESCGMENMTMLYNKIKMFTNRERYACARECRGLHYKDILKMLYDFKESMEYVR